MGVRKGFSDPRSRTAVSQTQSGEGLGRSAQKECHGQKVLLLESWVELGRKHCLESGDTESGIPAQAARVSPSPSPRAAWIPREGFRMGLMPSLLPQDDAGSEIRANRRW